MPHPGLRVSVREKLISTQCEMFQQFRVAGAARRRTAGCEPPRAPPGRDGENAELTRRSWAGPGRADYVTRTLTPPSAF